MRMAESELATLLASMEPVARPGEFVFVAADGLPTDVVAEATVWEPEGASAVLDRATANRLGLPYDYVAGWITLTVTSALDAVGLTAAVAGALAEAGLSCNVIAGLRHDHLLVPHERTEETLRVLRQLAALSSSPRRVTRPLLFTGDSITDAGRRTDAEQLGHGYVRVLAARLAAAGDPRPVLNTGISGNRVVDLQARWSDDVLAHEPETLSIYIGINDVWRRYDAGDPTRAADFEAGYRELLTRTLAASTPRLVLVEPFVTPVTVEQTHWHEDLDPKRAIVAELAREFGAAFVPLHAILTAAAAEHGAAAIAADGVHPTPLGHELIADAWQAAVTG